jgi:hypothetical protein
MRGLGHRLARAGRRGRLLGYLAVVVPLGVLGVVAAAGPAAAAPSQTSTTVSAPATGTVGTPIAANAISALLSGTASAVGGVITFAVIGPVSPGSPPPPPTCPGTSLGTVTVSGYGTYHASNGWTPESAGLYWYAACYSGDSQNAGSGSSVKSVVSNHLAITPPADITTDATTPSGATVTYPAPVVTDTGNPSPPAAVCTPASGSVFPIGTTTVHCSASDPDAAPPTVTTSFTITVLGAAAQLADLHQAVQHVGIGSTLAVIVAVAQHQLAAGHPRLACLTLTVFEIEVRMQTPWQIRPQTAAQLITDAKRIRAVLGCGTGLS